MYNCKISCVQLGQKYFLQFSNIVVASKILLQMVLCTSCAKTKKVNVSFDYILTG